jgi:hypothetical protein
MPRQPRQPSRENLVQAEIQRTLNRGPVRLLRNNVGAWKTPSGGYLSYGLGSSGSLILPGTSDFIGWRSRVITPAMVGQTIGQFVGVEVKDQGRATKDQLNFIAQVQAAGGLAGVAKNVTEARIILGLHLIE